MKLSLDSLHMHCHAEGDCLLWWRGTNSQGYPQANLDGKGGQMVRRYIFTELMGRKLPSKHRVAARCETPTCVAPAHLIARSFTNSLRLAYKRGRRMGFLEYSGRLNRMMREGDTRLDWEKVREIRSRPPSQTHAAIAAEFGMSQRAISDCRRGRTWKLALPSSSVFEWRP
jgi:hypothetical protein